MAELIVIAPQFSMKMNHTRKKFDIDLSKFELRCGWMMSVVSRYLTLTDAIAILRLSRTVYEQMRSSSAVLLAASER